jgi:hypothetical protein
VKTVSAAKVIALGALLGAAFGVGLALWRQSRTEAELERLAAATEALTTDALPAPPAKDPLAGAVQLPAVHGLPQYPGAFVRPVSQSDALDVAWFSTKDGLDDVIAFYEQELAAKGKIVVSHRYSAFAAYVGYRELSTGRLHLVSVLRQPDQTLVFPSQSSPEQLAQTDAKAPAGLPSIEGSEGGVNLELGEGPAPRKVWLTTFPNRTLEDVTRAWRAGLTASGWSIEPLPGGGSDAAVRIDATKGSTSARITLQRGAPSAVAVYVSLSGARNDAPRRRRAVAVGKAAWDRRRAVPGPLRRAGEAVRDRL